MHALLRCRSILGAAFLVVAASGCGRSGAPASAKDARPGSFGTSFEVTVYRPIDGTVSSADGSILCGSAADATRCGPVSFPWKDTVALVATPDAGSMFGTWAGDCNGRQVDANGKYTCFLGTGTYGGDKYVIAVFGPAGQAMHGNFMPATPVTRPTVHGDEFRNWIEKRNPGHVPPSSDYFDCGSCHGATYDGAGLAPSCNDCHAKAGHARWQTECNFCHGAPPPPLAQNAPHTAVHPETGSTDPKSCSGCHLKTVDSNGGIIAASAGGRHMDGNIDVTDPHIDTPDYDLPSKHGPDFLAHVSGDANALACEDCHGSDYGSPIVRGGGSCNSCHQSKGWVGDWKANCSFCHGVKDATTKQGYVLADHPTFSAPPDAIQQRLGGAADATRIGAHAVHLGGSAFAGPVACFRCHEVPATLSHIDDERAKVVLSTPGPVGASPNTYDAATGTCATYCHGANRSPTWSSSGMACDGCHSVPPATTIHAGLSSADLTVCADCHTTTMTSAGTIDTSGTHLNGTVDVIDEHPADFALPANHGNQFLNTVAGVSGALDCKSCHGPNLGLCSSCHSDPNNSTTTAWTSWKTNCTFCHGARMPGYTSAELAFSAPPDDVAQRLTGVEDPARTGQHSIHLFGGGVKIGNDDALPCSSCHTVPAAIEAPNHVTADRVAPYAITPGGAFPNLSAGDLAKLPNPLVAYDRSAGTCTGYCHGSAAWGGNNTVMNWTNDFSTSIQGCNDCHAQPPLTGRTVTTNTSTVPGKFPGGNVCPTGCTSHEFHRRIQAATRYRFDFCGNCHFGSAQGATYNGLHVNGKIDLVASGTALKPNGTATATTVTSVDFTWNATDRTCTSSCHIDSGTTVAQPW